MSSSVRGILRQEHWSVLPFPSPTDLPNPGIEPGSPALQADSLSSELPGKPNAGDPGSGPGLGRSPGGGHGSPLQSSCLENPVGRGAWRNVVRGVAKSRTRLSDSVRQHVSSSWLSRDSHRSSVLIPNRMFLIHMLCCSWFKRKQECM